MKKIILMLALGVMVAGSSFAQTAPQKDKKARTEHRGERGVKKDRLKEKKSPEERAQLKTDKLSQKLELNKSQTKKLQALNLKHEQQMQAMRANRGNAGDRNQVRTEMKAHHEQWHAELKDILSKKQYAKYESDQKEMRARMEELKEQRGKERAGRGNRPHRS